MGIVPESSIFDMPTFEGNLRGNPSWLNENGLFQDRLLSYPVIFLGSIAGVDRRLASVT